MPTATRGVTAVIGIATAVAGTVGDAIGIVAATAIAVPGAKIGALTAMQTADRIAVATVHPAMIAVTAATATATSRAIARGDATVGVTRARASKVHATPATANR